MNRTLTLTLIVLGVGWFLGGCGNLMTSSADITTVQKQLESQVLDLPGVVGVGVGECDGEPCLKVFVEQRTPELDDQIPEQLEGFKVDIEVTGPIHILPTPGTGSTSSDDIVSAHEHLESQVLRLPGVVGVAVGECDGETCLKVFVEEKTPELERQIPEQFEGIKVDIDVTGPVEIQSR
jgi:hypothetical protein